MNYTFTFTLNNIDIYNSSINFNKNSKTHLFDIIFTFVAFIVVAYTIYTDTFFQMDLLRKILLILCLLLFTVIQPIIFFIKSTIRIKKMGSFETKLTFDDEKVTVSAKDETSIVKYENIYDFLKYKNMLVLMYDSFHGQIMPNRIFEDKEEFYNKLSEKIIEARKNNEKTK